MDIELGTRYDPGRIEQSVYRFWEEGKHFHAEPDRPGDSYTIVIPPPNVTGALHMGHALNSTLQDILVRWRRMQGFNALWLPGTDHAGIATQNVVEQQLAHEGLHRKEIGREAFVRRVWDWKARFGGRIIDQLKRLGCSCDWERERFTLDEGLSRAVRETFVQLYERGLIYSGKYIINWCPRCRTALSDDEVEHEEHQGHLWCIRYAFKDDPSQYITVATTRPETMLGDTAVAVHPDDGRYKDLIGRTLVLPVLGREIPILADDWVDPEFGTGAVKVTPAHDPNDFAIAGRHGLPAVVVIDEDGLMTLEAGEQYAGMDRFECREALVEDLRERDDLEQITPHQHSVGHCYRCHTVIEPYLSDQWFVRMRPLADKAIQATREGLVRFHPQRWTEFYLSWLENVRDWCISRQIWWGHRLPVYYCGDCEETVAARERLDRCPKCDSTRLQQEEDVLDTWFSSSLWPFSTLGWPDRTADLERYYPTSTLVTDRGIIFFWVARMVMMGLEFLEEVPFSDVLIHGTIQDELGRKMSKSLGNGIDPIEMIDLYGADAVRFSLVTLTTEGQDVKLSESKFEMGRNFANKVWNASRFTMMSLSGGAAGGRDLSAEQLSQARTFEDQWILSRLAASTAAVTDYLESFRASEAAQTMYDFFWHEFCDWYLEATKLRLREESEDPADRAAARETLVQVLDGSLRLMHPFVPYLTEALWQQLKSGAAGAAPVAAGAMTADALIVSQWPAPGAARDQALEADMAFLQDIVRAVRRLRKEKGIEVNRTVRVVVSCPDADRAAVVADHADFLTKMALLEQIEHGVGVARPPRSAAAVVGRTEVFLQLTGLIDLAAERKRLEDQRQDALSHVARIEKQLQNPDFLANAPAQIVQERQDRAAELREKLQKIVQNLGELQ